MGAADSPKAKPKEAKPAKAEVKAKAAPKAEAKAEPAATRGNEGKIDISNVFALDQVAPS